MQEKLMAKRKTPPVHKIAALHTYRYLNLHWYEKSDKAISIANCAFDLSVSQ